MKQYAALLLDADETLLDFKKSEQTAFYNTIKAFGITPSEKLLRIYSSSNKEAWLLFEKNMITKDRLKIYRYERFLERAEIMGIKAEDINACYEKQLGKTGFVLDGAIDFLEYVKGRYKLYLVTNGLAVVQYSRLQNAGISHYFSHIFTSEELQAQKPHKKFFDGVFSQIPFKPEECLLIGDSLTSDIAGGIGYGIDTCFIDWFSAETDLQPKYKVKDLLQLLKLMKELGSFC